jgi:hypothetical protein
MTGGLAFSFVWRGLSIGRGRREAFSFVGLCVQDVVVVGARERSGGRERGEEGDVFGAGGERESRREKRDPLPPLFVSPPRVRAPPPTPPVLLLLASLSLELSFKPSHNTRVDPLLPLTHARAIVLS